MVKTQPLMTIAKITLGLVTLSIVTACEPQNGKRDQQLNTGTPTANQPNSLPPNPSLPSGTVDAGGGNTINGSPIEECRYDVESDPAFEKYLQPVLNHLDREIPIIGRVLRSGYKNKNWYVVPTPLSQIDRGRVGLVFNTEQTALTNFREVFLTQKIFTNPGSTGLVAQTASCQALKQAMQNNFRASNTTRGFDHLLRARAVLIFHELLMSFRLLKFDSPFRDCLAQASQSASCVGASTAIRGRPADLTFEDHQQVRSLTALWLRTARQKNHFALARDLYMTQFTLEGHDFEADSHPLQEISKEQFFDRLRISRSLESWPAKGFFTRVDMDQLPHIAGTQEEINGFERRHFQKTTPENSAGRLSDLAHDKSFFKTTQSFNKQLRPCSLEVDPQQQGLVLSIGGVSRTLPLMYRGRVFGESQGEPLLLRKSQGYEILSIGSRPMSSLPLPSTTPESAYWQWNFTFENNLLKMVQLTRMNCARDGNATYCLNSQNQSDADRASVTCF